MTTGLRRVGRWFRNRFAPGVLILLYHRVIELPSNPYLLCVTPQHFAEQMEILRMHTCPIKLQQLIGEAQGGRLPRRSVVITFDDGYADNFSNAKPSLEYHDIPATFFITTGYLERGNEFWWDELEQLLLLPETLPITLSINIKGNHYRWKLGLAHDSSQLLFRSLYQLLRPLSEYERRKTLTQLWRWRGAEPTIRPTHRTLSVDELSRLAEGGLAEIGSHGVTHPVLSDLQTDLQLTEIRQSKKHLEEILGFPVESFAYPYGTRSDYTADTTKMIRETGYRCACSNYSGLVGQGTDLFQLPRIPVFDWDGETFTRFLEEWFHGC